MDGWIMDGWMDEREEKDRKMKRVVMERGRNKPPLKESMNVEQIKNEMQLESFLSVS